MTIYSHSRLSCFEQCPHKYKLNYIDKIETEIEESIEAFLGVRVHEALEKLYRDLQHQKKNSLEDILAILNDEWEKNWNDSIIIVKKDYIEEHYRKMAEKFVSDYYRRYEPFKQGKTIALEERILINLDDSGDYKLQGYIDRLSEIKDGYYEIHDYKTNSRFPLPEYIKNYREEKGIPLTIKIISITLLWITIIFSAIIIVSNYFIQIILIIIAIAVTIHILTIKTMKKKIRKPKI